MPEPLLAVDEIQGNVMPGFNTRHQMLLGVRFDDVDAARAWLRTLVPTIGTLRQVNAVRDERRAAALRGDARPRQPRVHQRRL